MCRWVEAYLVGTHTKSRHALMIICISSVLLIHSLKPSKLEIWRLFNSLLLLAKSFIRGRTLSGLNIIRKRESISNRMGCSFPSRDESPSCLLLSFQLMLQQTLPCTLPLLQWRSSRLSSRDLQTRSHAHDHAHLVQKQARFNPFFLPDWNLIFCDNEKRRCATELTPGHHLRGAVALPLNNEVRLAHSTLVPLMRSKWSTVMQWIERLVTYLPLKSRINVGDNVLLEYLNRTCGEIRANKWCLTG